MIKTKNKNILLNFNGIIIEENLGGFICGCDTIFCIGEFGLDRVYYADYDCIKKKIIIRSVKIGILC